MKIVRLKKLSVKATIIAISVVLCLLAGVGAVLAYVYTVTDPVTNTFTVAEIKNEITENFDGKTKTNVAVKNTGDAEEWVRAFVLITWQDSSGNVYASAPVLGTDYTVTWFTDESWISGNDGLYYYKYPVKAGDSTSNLIETCTYIANAPAGYSLSVEVIASGIQSTPAQAFDAWKDSSGLTIADDGSSLVKND